MAGTTVNIPIQAQDHFTLVFNRLQSGLNHLDRSLAPIRAGWIAFAAGATAAAAGIGAVIKQGSEGQQTLNKLNAVLRATGHSAGMTRTEILGIVDDLTALSQFDDDAIAGAASELLKFGNITKATFKDALAAVVDFAAFTGKSVPDAAQAVGKALQSPVEGLGMLEREIGKLTPSQEKMLKNLVESNRLAEAQAAVLDILRGKFGGMAQEMNSGYLQVQSRVSKAWNEFLEATGKWGPVATTVSGGFNMVAAGLEKMKTIIESGNWWEKWLLMTGNPLSMAASLGSNAAFGKTPGQAAPSGDERRKAMQGDLDRQRKEWEAGIAAQTDAVNKIIADKQEKSHKEFLEREKRLQEEGVRGWVAHADAVFAEAERELLAIEKIWDEHWDREEKLRQEDIKGWVAYAEAVFDEAFEMYSDLARIADETNDKATKAAKELGMVFVSAFEDAIVGGQKLRDVLKGLAQDVLRLFIRKTVTEPGAALLGELFKGMFPGTGGGAGSAAGSAVVAAPGGGMVPALASGTPFVQRDGLAFLHRGEAVIPSNQNNGGGITVIQHLHFSANTPAASRDAVMAAAPVLVNQAVVAVRNERNRSGDRR